MICTGYEGQTALDFYLTLKSRKEVIECRGPIVYLKLNSSVANRLSWAASTIGVEGLVTKAFITLVEDDLALFGSCMGHWTDISSIAFAIGEQTGRLDVRTVGDRVFRECCNVLGWDYRELDNYLHSLDLPNRPEEE